MKLRFYIIFIVFIFSFYSCEQVVKATASALKEDNKVEVTGKYHTLKSENIRVFLPDDYSYISTNDYRKILDNNTSIDTLIKQSELNRLKLIESMKLNIYFFGDFNSGEIINVIPSEYVRFNKQDAEFMYSFVYNQLKKTAPVNTDFKKIEAQFKNSSKTQIFKTIFKYNLPNQLTDFYKYVYFISQNENSAFVIIETPNLINFDDYITRIKL